MPILLIGLLMLVLCVYGLRTLGSASPTRVAERLRHGGGIAAAVAALLLLLRGQLFLATGLGGLSYYIFAGKNVRHSGHTARLTNGTGQMPASTVSIPADQQRRFLYVQNLDTTALSVTIATVKQSDGTTTTSTIPLAAAPSAGAAGGGVLRCTLYDFVFTGAVTVTGTSGKQAIILTQGS